MFNVHTHVHTLGKQNFRSDRGDSVICINETESKNRDEMQISSFGASDIISSVTAVEHVQLKLGHFLLLGHSSAVKVINCSTGLVIKYFYVFKYCSCIHRIISYNTEDYESKLIIYGGKEIVVASFIATSEDIHLSILRHSTMANWILSLAVISNDEILVVDAHNNAFSLSSNLVVNSGVIRCSEKNILYCSLIIGDELNTSIIFSGTVYCHILIWSPEFCDKMNQAKILHKLQGHDGVIFSISYDKNLNLLASVSDDRTVRLWKTSSSDFSTNSIMSHLIVYGHLSRIWDVGFYMDYVLSLGEDGLLIVSKTDGSFSAKCNCQCPLWSMKSYGNEIALCGSGGGVWMVDLPLLLGKCDGEQSNIPCESKPRDIYFFQSNLLVMTQMGVLYVYDLKSNEKVTIQDTSDEFVSYSCVAVYEDLIAIAGIYGHLKIFSGDQQIMLRISDGKVFALVWLSRKQLLVSLMGGMILFCSVSSDCHITTMHRLLLPHCRYRWISTACIVDENLLMCGDRSGSIHLYDLKGAELLSPVSSHWKVHGKSGVTDIKMLDQKIFSCGRNGKLALWSLHRRNIRLCHGRSVLSGMDWLAQICLNNSHFLLLGFHSNRFVCYDVRDGQVLKEIECGGGHRGWDCFFEENILHLSFIQAGSVVHASTPIDRSLQLLCKPFYLKEINCCTNLPIQLTGGQLMLLGSEDTHLYAVAISGSDNTLTLLEKIPEHTSSIRAVAACAVAGTNQMMVASGGGRGEINLWIFEVEADQLVYRHLFKHHPSKKVKCIKESPDVRVMCLSLMEKCGEYFVMAGLSDATVSFHSYVATNNLLDLLSVNKSHKSCLLSCKLFHCSSDASVYFFASDTTGVVSFWNFSHVDSSKTDCLDPCWTEKLHKSGVNALDVSQVDSELLLLSGADDGSFAMHKISENFPCICLFHQCCHSSQLTVTKFVGAARFITSGIDQRLNVWSHLSVNDDGKPSLEQALFSPTSDIHDAVVLSESVVVLCGMGISIMLLDH